MRKSSVARDFSFNFGFSVCLLVLKRRRLHILSDWIIITLITNQVKVDSISVSISDVTWRSFAISGSMTNNFLRNYCCIQASGNQYEDTTHMVFFQWKACNTCFTGLLSPRLALRHQERTLKSFVVKERKKKARKVIKWKFVNPRWSVTRLNQQESLFRALQFRFSDEKSKRVKMTINPKSVSLNPG